VQTLELSIGNDIATRVAALAARRELVTLHREKLIRVQRTLVEESQKQQNYMLIGAFDLLAAKQHQYEGYEAYVGTLRDYWLAYVDLIRATGGRYPGVQPAADQKRMESLAAIEARP
jgi:cobalt-zinc-cadmium efflux system outer membrane protein